MSIIDTPKTQNANRRFIRAAMDAPLLEPAHELELARRWKEERDEAALHELTQSYMRLVVSIATRFRNYGLPFGDLVQEGNVGLMQAAARFEPERELRFSTYATWWIRAAIQDYVLRNWSIVRTGTTRAQKSLFFNLRRIRATIKGESDQMLSPSGKAFIARELKVKISDVEHMENRMATADRSLNAPMSEANQDQWQDFLTDERDLPDQIVEDCIDGDTHRDLIGQAMSMLSQRESTIIRKRKLEESVVTLEDLGKELGISKERVRQLEGIALKKIRTFLEDLVGNPDDAGLSGR